jgi:hypothetical protein
MILDANETPGGLASTDATPEGFVSLASAATVAPIEEGQLVRC